jgi:hypothetical protein
MLSVIFLIAMPSVVILIVFTLNVMMPFYSQYTCMCNLFLNVIVLFSFFFVYFNEIKTKKLSRILIQNLASVKEYFQLKKYQ